MSTDYDETFRAVADGNPPHDYQRRVAELLWQRKNILLRAPTGAGKTLAVLAPFLHNRWRIGARRLIYALPLRALANGIFAEAQRICGSEYQVTMQTGEQPDDPYFTNGDVIVTTYDQVLSGLLCGPYGLGPRQHNVNAALVAGNLVVFDEFHLMEIARAFLSGITCMSLFSSVARSVWMTATATTPLHDELSRVIGTVQEGPTPDEEQALYTGSGIRRSLRKRNSSLSGSDVLKCATGPTLVVVNQVKRAQRLYKEVVGLASQAGFPSDRIVLLHARFFRADRDAKQQFLKEHFGKKRNGPAVAIATQVVEAGLDLSAENLLTEICPVNALVQRAGRCARFQGQSGVVHVFPLDAKDSHPYGADQLEQAWNLIEDSDDVTPRLVAGWVEAAHEKGDRVELEAARVSVRSECIRQIMDTIQRRANGGVAHLIREQSDTVRVMIANDPANCLPSTKEAIPVYRDTLRGLVGGRVWTFDPDAPTLWRPALNQADIAGAYAVALSPEVARYTKDLGLEIGLSGEACSPARTAPKRPGYGALGREAWASHSRTVQLEAERRLRHELIDNGLVATGFNLLTLARCIGSATLLHDLGKLQDEWQRWAEAYQTRKEPGYRHEEALAHTSYDSRDPEDRALERATKPARPPHAAASAFYASRLFQAWNGHLQPEEKRAIVVSILSHHGGWWQQNTEILPVHKLWSATLQQLGMQLDPVSSPSYSQSRRFDNEYLEPLFGDSFEKNWPLAAYLIRVLRLSDSKATEEARTDG